MLKEFKDFVMRGSLLELAVAFILGVAFGRIVTSLLWFSCWSGQPIGFNGRKL